MTDQTDEELTLASSHLLARYAWAIDDRDYADLAEVFTADVVADYQAFVCHGVHDLVATMERIHRDLVLSQHLVVSVTARGVADGTALVRSHVRATLVRGRGAARRVEVAASYRDRMVRTGVGLRIAERRVEGHWIAGDRSILPWFEGVDLRDPKRRAVPPGNTSSAASAAGESG